MAESKTEHFYQIKIMEHLAERGIYCWRNNSGALRVGRRMVRFGKVGSSDILGIHPESGKFVAIEVKRPDMSWKPTLAQLEFLQAIHINGGLAGIATSPDEVDRILSGEYLIP